VVLRTRLPLLVGATGVGGGLRRDTNYKNPLYQLTSHPLPKVRFQRLQRQGPCEAKSKQGHPSR